MDDENGATRNAKNQENILERLTSVDRRGVLVGIALGATAPGVAHAVEEPGLRRIRLIRNPVRHQEIGVGIEAMSDSKKDALRAVSLYSRLFDSQALVDWKERNGKLSFTFSDIRFSDRKRYALTFTADYDDQGVSGLRARLTRTGDSAFQVESVEGVKLEKLVDGAPFKFRLNKDQANAFRWDLFGERIEFIGDGRVTLSLSMPPSDPDAIPTGDWEEPDLRLALEPDENMKLWAFEQCVSVQELSIARVKGDRGHGADMQFELQRGTSSADRRPVWIATGRDLKWSDDVTTKTPRGYFIGAAAKPHVSLHATNAPTSFALRQWGSARKTVAILRAPLEVRVRAPRQTGLEPAVFPLVDAELAKYDLTNTPAKGPSDNKDERLAQSISGAITSKAFQVDTPVGVLIVEGDPAPRDDKQAAKGVGEAKSKKGEASPAQKPQRPAKGLTHFHLAAQGDALTSFDARALLRQIAVGFPSVDENIHALTEDGGVWSRFDFNGTEIAFRIPDLETANPSARGIVALCAPTEPLPLLSREPALDKNGRRQPESRPGATIALDGARLSVRRDSDNLALTFQFVRMALELGRNEGRIVPNLRLTGAGAGMAASFADERTFDDRSLLIAHFPPQHVAERAYYRQVNDGVALPPAASEAIDEEKHETKFVDGLRALRMGDKDVTREALFKVELANVEAVAASAAPIRDRFLRSRLGELLALIDRKEGSEKLWADWIPAESRSALIARWKLLPFDQRTTYLGSSSLAIDPDVRAVWRDIWRHYLRSAPGLPKVPGDILRDAAFVKGVAQWRNSVDADPKNAAALRTRLAHGQAQAVADAIKNNDAFASELKNSRIENFLALFDSAGTSGKWTAAIKDDATKTRLLKLWDALQKEINDSEKSSYLGASAAAMTPEARQVWEQIWLAYVKENPAPQSQQLSFDEAVDLLPDAEDAQGRKRNADVVEFAEFYAKARQKDGSVPDGMRADLASLASPPLSPPTYEGRHAMRDWQDALDNDNSRYAALRFVRLCANHWRQRTEAFRKITPARLSGPSRLVFRFDAAGGSLDRADPNKRSDLSEDKERVRAIPLTVEGLTDWGRFDLAVARRAETLESRPGGRTPHPDLRGVDMDPARMLAFQGIKPGGSIAQRLKDIADTLRPPRLDETAIELPFRIQLSPDQFGRFRTRRPVRAKVLTVAAGADEKKLMIAPSLWSANLLVGDVFPTVRAIWSDDFRPGALTSGERPPERGSSAPWRLLSNAQRSDFRTALDAYDRHEIVALSSVYGLPVMGRRNEANNLVDASQFEPPPGYQLSGELKKDKDAGRDLSGIYNPTQLNIAELRLTAFGGSLRHDTTFVPPASVVRANDQTLFEAMSVERWRQVTVLGRDIEVEVVYKGFLYPLGVRASLVKLTERRILRNDATGAYTAFLIQRQFVRVGKPEKTFPAVGQPDRSRRFPVSQIAMLTRETPDIVDPAETSFASSRKVAAGLDCALHAAGRIDLLDGRGAKLPGLCFWPRTRPIDAGNIVFEFKIDGDAAPLRMPMIFVDNKAANSKETLAALTSYYNIENSTAADVALATDNLTRRTLQMGGARRKYADENKDGECTFETQTWEIRVEGRRLSSEGAALDYEFDPLLQGADQPPFYPYVHSAVMRIGQAERFVGRPLMARRVKFVDKYRDNGFPSAASLEGADADKRFGPEYFERYLKLITDDGKQDILDLDMGEAGDRSGAIGRPALPVAYISRRLGLMPKELPTVAPQRQQQLPKPRATGSTEAAQPSAPPPFDLSNFFSGEAKLLGIISFTDLLKEVLSAAPELKESVEAATEDTATLLRDTVLPAVESAVATLDKMWSKAKEELQKKSSNVGAPFELDQIYPDIGPALRDLRDKLASARNASTLELPGAMTVLQGSGRKFVTAVNRTLADPIAPLREDLRTKFRDLSNTFANGLAVDAALEIAKSLDRQKTKLIEAVATALNEASLARLVIRLPASSKGFLPEDLFKDGKVKRDPIKEFVDPAALAAATTFLLEASKDGFDPSKLQGALKTAAKAGRDKLRDLIKNAKLSTTLAESLEAIAKEVDSSIKADKFDRLLGSAFVYLFGNPYERLEEAQESVAQIMRGALGDLSAALSAGGGDPFKSIGKNASKLLDVVVPLITEVKNAADIQASVTKQIETYLKPDFADVAKVSDDLKALAKSLGVAEPNTNDIEYLFNQKQVLFNGFKAGANTEVKIYWIGLMRELSNARALALKTPNDILKRIVERYKDAPQESFASFNKLVTATSKILVAGDLTSVKDELTTLRDSASKAGLPLPAELDNVIKRLVGTINDVHADLDTAKTQELERARKAFEGLIGNADHIAAIESQLLTIVGQTLGFGRALNDQAVKQVAIALAPFFAALGNAYAAIAKTRADAKARLDGTGWQKFLQFVRGKDGRSLGELFDVPPRNGGREGLQAEIDTLAALADTAKPLPPAEYLKTVQDLAKTWSDGSAAPVVLARKLGDVLSAILRGDLAEFVDLEQVRREIEEAIRNMVPARVTRSYDMNLKLGKSLEPLITFSNGAPHPLGAPETLVVHASGVVDLREPKNSSFQAQGYLPGFKLQLLPAFDVATFTVAPATFVGGSGVSMQVSFKVVKVDLGEKVQFLKKIESILPAPKNGKGFFVRPMSGRGGIGIVAGYALPISPITIGNMFIDNLSLNAAAELPFDNGDARFVISVSRPEAPFMIAAAPYAGAGHFGLIANPKGIIGFEASMQFGGGGGFSFGPLTGQGRISVGIYIRKISGFTELYGLFYAGGSARIACFGVGAQLNVRMKADGGDLSGEAVFTYSFSIGIKDIEFSVAVYKKEEGSGKSEKSKQGSVAPRSFYASTELPHLPVLKNETSCKGQNFSAYSKYFVMANGMKPGRGIKPPPKKNKTAAETLAAAPSPWPAAGTTFNAWVMP